jgi:hypothetical protein
MKRKSKGRDGKSAVDILEEAMHLLRANAFLLVPYYCGSLPFILGLLYFWTDMSTGADAWRRCSKAAWGLTLLFIWMKTWQSLYNRRPTLEYSHSACRLYHHASLPPGLGVLSERQSDRER